MEQDSEEKNDWKENVRRFGFDIGVYVIPSD
jgi:hypothetical protein